MKYLFYSFMFVCMFTFAGANIASADITERDIKIIRTYLIDDGHDTNTVENLIIAIRRGLSLSNASVKPTVFPQAPQPQEPVITPKPVEPTPPQERCAWVQAVDQNGNITYRQYKCEVVKPSGVGMGGNA